MVPFPASGKAGRIRHAGGAHHRKQLSQWRSDPPRWCDPHGRQVTPLNPGKPYEYHFRPYRHRRRQTHPDRRLPRPVCFARLPATRRRCHRGSARALGVHGGDISEAIIGCVLPAGVGQAPARQAIVGAGLPRSVACTTVNKVCGFGDEGGDARRTTSSSRRCRHRPRGRHGIDDQCAVPAAEARGGYRLGHGQVLDHMFYDGLQNPYDPTS